VIHLGLAGNLAMLILRVFLGGMIFAHGLRKVVHGGKLTGTAGWFESIGMRFGRLNAFMAATTEMGVGVLLVGGFLTPLAAAGLVALMTVAIVTVHRFNGFWVFTKGQGVEYCASVIASALVVGTFGGGKYSLDYLARHLEPFRWLSHPGHALVVTAAVGFGGALLQLLALYRPPTHD
jgi:putative oxidoreductase